ncbi:MAG TPA: alpha-amylase family glycosyl hydrolase [Candidatus Acidoferrales bacterium]|jgi:1,4-alpha-glucan branching enzyme|nr:alpha-amylase family glycosyl hydrolase [Candidatus Acidoferrales bacterium]
MRATFHQSVMLAGNIFLAVLACGVCAIDASAQSSRTGMGSIPYSDAGGSGVTFRVWAPDATSVAVTGDFNGWSSTANLLVKESGGLGLWSADIPNATAGQQYKYKLSGTLSKMDPRSRKVVNSAGNSIIYDPNAFNWAGDTRLPVSITNLVIYEMHVGAFYDSTPSSGGPGKFSDATTKLDYLASLGVGAVELMPIAEFPTDNSWGYNPSDVYAVENSGYGGPDGLKSFVKAAHQRGIRVLLDVVHNHYGSGDLDMYSFDTGTGPSIYFYTASGISTTPWGPRPNYSTDGVRSFIIDSFRMWMDECHVDGFRWDAVGAIRQYDNGGGNYVGIPDADSLLQYINSTVIHSDHPGAISIAEDDSGGMAFDSTWGVSYGDEVINEMTQSSDSSRSMANLKSNMDGSGFGRVLYTETHDLVGALNGSGAQRLPVRIQSSNPSSYFARKRSMMGAAIVMTTPGIPQIFMGQERLDTNQFSDSSPLNWSLVTTYSNVWNFYHDMIRLRRNLDGVSAGLTGPNISWHVVDDTAKVLAYHRWGAAPNDQVMVVINCSNKPLTNYSVGGFPANGTWYVNLNTDWPIYGSDFENKGAAQVQVSGGTGSITLGRYSVQLLSRLSLSNTNPVAQFAGSQVTGTNFMMNWTGGQAFQQVILQSTNAAGPWKAIYTNQPPAGITNSISIPITGSGSSFFRIQTGP